MTREQLHNGLLVNHVKYGQQYIILSANARMKDSQKGWVDCVVYVPWYENDYQCFTREVDSFLAEFELVI